MHETFLRQTEVTGRNLGHYLSFAYRTRITDIISVTEKRSGNKNPNKNVKARDDLFPIYQHWQTLGQNLASTTHLVFVLTVDNTVSKFVYSCMQLYKQSNNMFKIIWQVVNYNIQALQCIHSRVLFDIKEHNAQNWLD